MLLAIDIGNTEIAFGLFDDTRLAANWRLASHPERTTDEYLLLLDSALRRFGIALSEVSASIVATTSPQLLSVFSAACGQLFGHRAMEVGPGIKTRMKVRFDPPTDLSGDRIANAVAAYYLHGGGPVVIVDFGTATAFDVVSAKGEYLGGAVAPGMRLGAGALVERTARIPTVELAAPPTVIGHNSTQALQSGLVYGHVAMLEGMLCRIKQEIGTAKVIATGDWAGKFASLTSALDIVVPNLTLEGLRLLYQFNPGVGL